MNCLTGTILVILALGFVAAIGAFITKSPSPYWIFLLVLAFKCSDGGI